jgi:hypothetical protein
MAVMRRLIHLPTFFITVACCLILLFIFVSLRLKLPLDCEFKRKSSKKILRECRTGDIIAVAYGSKRAKLVKVFTGSMWAHSAVIVRANDNEIEDAYVLEVARYSREERGIMVTKFDEWLDKNESNLVAISRYKGASPDQAKVKSFLKEHNYLKEEMFVAKWLAAMVKTRYYDNGIQNKKKVFCSELVTHFLQSIGIMRKKYNPHGYKPWELLYGKKHLTNPKKSHYDRPMLIE